MRPPTYSLAENVYICTTDMHCIILDVRKDNYLSVPAREFLSLGPWLYGWTRTIFDSCESMSMEVQELANQLVGAGILVCNDSCPRPVKVAPYIEPSSMLTAPPLGRLSWNSVAAQYSICMLACARAACLLRHHKIEAIVASVRRQANANTGRPFDQQRISNLVSIFNRFRSYFPHDYVCLFDSLALLKFLSFYGYHPVWIFGVSAEPFMAHCWLQQDEMVLNDTLAAVRSYRIIMTA